MRENRERMGRRAQRGQSLTEFALVAPLLFALIFGVFDLGRGMSANVTVTNSAREGARYLVTHATSWSQPGTALAASQGRFDQACPGTGSSPAAPPADSAQGVAWRQLEDASLDLSAVTMTVRFYASNDDPHVNPAQPSDTFTCSGGVMSESKTSYQPESGDWVQFEVQYHYAPVTPGISSLLATVRLDQTTTMVLE
jgi:Flp pilus assembly protein TadG